MLAELEKETTISILEIVQKEGNKEHLNSTVKISLTVEKEGDREVSRKLEVYNLDMGVNTEKRHT